ncbi:Ig-like domain-containing protein [Clostridium felsineum]|uniref:Ig-like domain-containing protein n=1 Tax=Clostridium felsineum TaxID=36839 RepID=UPI00214D66E1|nr:Ig-like domain-containing protein [Clostridium felsineum]
MRKLSFKCLLATLTCFTLLSTAGNVNGFKADTNNDTSVGVTYDAHVQNIGWQTPWSSNGEEVGTDGKSLRVEALKIKLTNAPANAKIEYQAHVENIGWQDWVSDGAEAGTDGKGLRIEALKLKLDNMPDYTIQYSAHVQNIGWQDWVSDGEEAGTDGKGLRVEALKIRIVKKVHPDSVTLNKAIDNLTVGDTDTLSASIMPNNAMNQNVNWSSSNPNIVSVNNGKITALAEGSSTITATTVDGEKTASCSVNVAKGDIRVQYQTHVQNIGWQDPVLDGREAGTDGQGLRIEALKINLLNAPAGAKIVYQAHVQNIGWQNPVSNGGEAGTDGQGLRVEALKIHLENMPGYSVQYQAHIQNIGWQDWRSEDGEAGTDGQGLRVEALRIKIVKAVSLDSINLNKSTDTLTVGDTDNLTASFNPSNATNKNLSWTSSDPSKLYVDNNGKITAYGTGNVTITATSNNGNRQASCVVTIKGKTITNPNEITFADRNLENAIRAVINKPNGTLYKSDVLQIQSIDLSGRGLRSLNGIENLTNLQALYLSNNYIIDVSPLKSLTNLNTLVLDDNSISDLSPLKSLTNLSSLSMPQNNFSDIDALKNLTNLKHLDFSYNKVIDLNPLKNLNNLTYLLASYNNINDLSALKNLTKLEIIGLTSNSVNNVTALNSLSNLNVLYISNNPINHNDLEALKNTLPNCTIVGDNEPSE